MRVNALIVTVFAVWIFGAREVPADPGGASNACDDCDKLCPLMDLYLQKQEGIKFWKHYADTTTGPDRWPLPRDFQSTFHGSMEDMFGNWFSMWLDPHNRKLPCKQPDPDPSHPQQEGPSTLAETNAATCEIMYQGKKLDEPGNREKFEDAWKCSAITNAIVEHEQVHQRHCREAHAKGEKAAVEYYNNPALTAQDELEAWERERDLLKQQIQQILSTKDCGWVKTSGQQSQGSNAMPSRQQVMDMQQRGWKAVSVLGGATH